jgi:hypothetical protein
MDLQRGDDLGHGDQMSWRKNHFMFWKIIFLYCNKALAYCNAGINKYEIRPKMCHPDLCTTIQCRNSKCWEPKYL